MRLLQRRLPNKETAQAQLPIEPPSRQSQVTVLQHKQLENMAEHLTRLITATRGSTLRAPDSSANVLFGAVPYRGLVGFAYLYGLVYNQETSVVNYEWHTIDTGPRIDTPEWDDEIENVAGR